MTERDITPELDAALDQASIALLVLVEFIFDDETIRLWNGVGDLSWNNATWDGAGSLLSISAIKETTEIRADGARFVLSGIPTSIVNLALQKQVLGRKCGCWFGVVEDREIVTDPYKIFSGRMDSMPVEENGQSSSVTVIAENRMVDLERARERRYTDEDQRIDYPDDRGLEYVGQLQEIEVTWGRT